MSDTTTQPKPQGIKPSVLVSRIKEIEEQEKFFAEEKDKLKTALLAHMLAKDIEFVPSETDSQKGYKLVETERLDTKQFSSYVLSNYATVAQMAQATTPVKGAIPGIITYLKCSPTDEDKIKGAKLEEVFNNSIKTTPSLRFGSAPKKD